MASLVPSVARRRFRRESGRVSRRLLSPIVAVALLLAAAAPSAAGAAPARPRVAVIVVPRLDPAVFARRGAVGLLVPGAGAWVSREGALAALARGRVQSALLGGRPEGKVLIRVGGPPGDVTFYVTLPPPGRSHNVRRYEIAVVGGGYRGLLLSDATRIPGLVSVADVARAAVALERGKRPLVRSRPEPRAPETLARLDLRLSRAHDARAPASLVLLLTGFVACLLVSVFRTPLLGRLVLLTVPGAVLGALVASAAGIEARGAVAGAVAVAAGPAALGAALLLRDRRALGAGLLAYVAVLLFVMWAWPEVNSLSAIGPHPDGGGRFYGLTNQATTLLTLPALAAAALLSEAWTLPVAALVLVTVGLSRAGADGGGALSLLAGFAFLALRRRGLRLTPARLLLVGAGIVAVVLVLVGADALTGGSSHVTGAVGSGPGGLLGDFGHRIHVSAAGAVSSWRTTLATFASLAGILVFAGWRPAFPLGDGLLAALAVSLVVNDTPSDVLGFGVLACGLAWGWERFGRTPPEPSG